MDLAKFQYEGGCAEVFLLGWIHTSFLVRVDVQKFRYQSGYIQKFKTEDGYTEGFVYG